MSQLLRSLTNRPRFSRDVNLLLIATGLLAISFFGIQTFLKILYILRLGYGPVFLGLFNASGALAYMAMSLPSGALGGRIGLTRTMLLGALVTVLGMAMLPLTESIPAFARHYWPIFSQLILSGGYAMFSINLAPALMGLTSDENRSSAYAMSSTLRSLGTFTGTVVAGLLPGIVAGLIGEALSSPGPYRLALWLSPAIGLLAVIPLLRIGDADAVTRQDRTASESGAFPVGPVGLFILFVCFSQAAGATCQSFCNAYMDAELHLSPALIGVISGVGQFAAIFAPMVLPGLARWRGNGWTLMMATIGSAASLVPAILLPNMVGAALGRFGTQALSAVRMPALQVYQMEMIEKRWRALAYGAVSTAMGLSFAIVSFSGGRVAALWGYRSLFLMGVTISLVGALIMWVLLKRPALMVTARGAAQ